MPPEQETPAGADAPAGTGTAAPSTQPEKPADASSQPEVWRNVDEIKKALAEVNALRSQLRDTLGRTPGGSKDAPVPAPVADPVAELRAEMALKDAVADAGLGQYRKRIEKLWRAENPPDVDSWLKATAEEMGWSTGGAPAKPAQIPATETPPPTTATSRSIASHPGALTKEQIDGMSDVELKSHWEAFKKASGHFVHPGAAHKRERMQSNGVGEQIGRAITDALNRR